MIYLYMYKHVPSLQKAIVKHLPALPAFKIECKINRNLYSQFPLQLGMANYPSSAQLQ